MRTRPCLVSGGFTLFTSRVGAMIGFENRGNVVVEDGRLARESESFGREAKLVT